jgi:hypothetical protein
MISPSHRNHLSRESTLGRNFPIGKGFGMIASRKRLGRRLDSKANMQGDGEENMALINQAKKGKGKGSKGNSEGATSQSGKKKDLCKIKCFACTRVVIMHLSVQRRRVRVNHNK